MTKELNRMMQWGHKGSNPRTYTLADDAIAILETIKKGNRTKYIEESLYLRRGFMKIIEKHELTIAQQGEAIQSYIRQLHELQAKQGGGGVGPTGSD
jgi:hypothetical protein